MTARIIFGTDGWRGLIADDFTFENVARCSQGLATYLKTQGRSGKGVVVGYDTRFLSREFAETVAKVCAGNGIKVFLTSRPAPTPVVSFNVLHHKTAGAVIITASHNPAVWNGFKFKTEYAATASQETTSQLEDAVNSANEVRSIPLDQARANDLVVEFDPQPPYLKQIQSLVELQAIREAGLTVAVDAMFGAGAGYLPALLSGGKTTVTEINGYRNPAFPGIEQPEPIAANLTGLAELIQRGGVSVGLALDGDADRLGVMDEHGEFITTLQVFSLLALYLLESKSLRGPLVKGVTSSVMLNKLGDKFGVPVHEMKVGFKNIAPMMIETNALMGGEESGGYAFRGHIPERDGILSGLLILENMVRTGRSPAQLVEHLFSHVGTHYYHRRDVPVKRQDRERILRRLKNGQLSTLAGMPVRSSDDIDGRRLIFDHGWLATRLSGTEPLLRIYAEADTPERVNQLLDAAAEYLGI